MGGTIKMIEKKEKRTPDYKGSGVAVWKNYDKDGNIYLTIEVLGNCYVNAFKYEPKEVNKQL